jgi:hypothetical protein
MERRMGRIELEPVVLRQVGRSLYMRVPAPFVRANQLKAGDHISLVPDKHFKIIRPEDFEKLGREPELERRMQQT